MKLRKGSHVCVLRTAGIKERLVFLPGSSMSVYGK